VKAFTFEGELYIRCIPAKTLFHSTLVHEVVNRGDIFALRVSDQKLTVIKGLSTVEHCEIDTVPAVKKDTKTVAAMRAGLRKRAGLDKLNQMEIPL
jgi:hypothetical protein